MQPVKGDNIQQGYPTVIHRVMLWVVTLWLWGVPVIQRHWEEQGFWLGLS